MDFNVIYIVGSGIIPLITGFIWYNPKVMGDAWMKVAGMDEEKMKNANMGVIFGLTFVLGVFLSAALMSLTIHQIHYFSILADNPDMKDPNSAVSIAAKEFMDMYGNNFRTFKHGAFHGILAAIMFAMPVLAINALFERRGSKYIFIHTGYWIITLAIMGGVICGFA